MGFPGSEEGDDWDEGDEGREGGQRRMSAEKIRSEKGRLGEGECNSRILLTGPAVPELAEGSKG